MGTTIGHDCDGHILGSIPKGGGRQSELPSPLIGPARKGCRL
jgi:hypothetical protein